MGIAQHRIAGGGRLQVLVEMVRILNSHGIVPDVLTFGLTLSPDEVRQMYGTDFDVRLRVLPQAVSRLSHEASIIYFNWVLRRYGGRYDVLVNSNNAWAFLPRDWRVLTYMHFPRKLRIRQRARSIHEPDSPLPAWSRAALERVLLRCAYAFERRRAHHRILCNSEFTRDALLRATPQVAGDPLLVAYPPVDLSAWWNRSGDREPRVVTLGRFSRTKRQLLQIRLARALPDVPFHIVGFGGDSGYYQACRDAVADLGLRNVHLHHDLDLAAVVGLVQRSKCFLHTMVNEPFGIAPLQAVAAGCLPIVHDSGGVREIVPEPGLRFSRVEDVPGMIRRVIDQTGTEEEDLRGMLQRHVRDGFGRSGFEDVFRGAMQELLEPGP